VDLPCQFKDDNRGRNGVGNSTRQGSSPNHSIAATPNMSYQGLVANWVYRSYPGTMWFKLSHPQPVEAGKACGSAATWLHMHTVKASSPFHRSLLLTRPSAPVGRPWPLPLRRSAPPQHPVQIQARRVPLQAVNRISMSSRGCHCVGLYPE
jgi:hypothetical protein